MSSPPNRAARRNQARKPQQARQVEEIPPEGFDQSGWKIFEVMRDDVEKARVRDLVLKSSHGLKVILTVSREFFKDDTAEYLLGGRFTALGKITRVLESGEMINLTRRTALGLAGPDVARGLINEIGSDSEDFAFRAEDPIVEAPALQLLPLAIFI